MLRQLWSGVFKCNGCGRELKQGDFIAVIGHTPTLGMGRCDAVLKTTGEIYCDACFNKRWQRSSTE